VLDVRSEEEVNKMIEEMKNRTKGKYLTQGCSFNKDCPRQMDMLKKALMSSASFSGLVKEMLAMRFGGGATQMPTQQHFEPEMKQKNRNVGNFI
jgi:hypothetical protein